MEEAEEPVIALRRAERRDAGLLREWRNEPAVRAASRNTKLVGEAEHARWVDRLLADPERHLLIAQLDGEPVGQIRFEPRGGRRYEVTVSLAADRRGVGLGRSTLALGLDYLWSRTPAVRAEAWVRSENAASLRAFALAGFEAAGEGREGEFVRLVTSRPAAES